MTKQVSLRSFDADNDPVEATRQRRVYVEQQLDIPLDVLACSGIEPTDVVGKNIENLIGEISLPLGVAGPINVLGVHAKGSYYIPCATTEGALTASISRGCKALTESGGVVTHVEYRGISRAPLFELKGIQAVKQAETYIKEAFPDLRDLAAQTSGHIELIAAETHTLGKYLWVRLSFDTQEAMGMNMASNAAERISAHIVENIENCRLIALSGNVCVDKKPSVLNIIKGRGYHVTAECIIPDEVLKSVLHTTAQAVAEVCRTKNWYGSGLSGSLGANAQAANIIAAIYTATGQDIAHVAESSLAFTVAEEVSGGLYLTVTLPDIICGSVGGGTGLRQQRAAFLLMTHPIDTPQFESSHPSECFAEILSAAVLSGELSLLAALSTNTLASAHRKLTGRQKDDQA